MAKPRTTRIRESTRAKLVEAAERVIAAKGVDATTIADITETADVGTGSFYNHFKTKGEVAEVIFLKHADNLSRVNARIYQLIPDAAQAIAFIQKVFLRQAVNDPIWGWFVVHATTDLPQLAQVFGLDAAEHIARGQQLGRLAVSNVDVAVRVILVALTAGMRDLLQGDRSDSWGDDIVASLLQLLGVTPDEARDLSRLPLPAEIEVMAQAILTPRKAD